MIEEGVKTINKRKYAFFEFTSEHTELVGSRRSFQKYNYILYTPYKKHILIFHFSCDKYVIDKYQPIAKAMINSVKVSSSVSLPDFYLQQNNNVPRKRQTPQDIQEMLNKSKTNIKK